MEWRIPDKERLDRRAPFEGSMLLAALRRVILRVLFDCQMRMFITALATGKSPRVKQKIDCLGAWPFLH